jgi:hypothetical protein
MRLGGRIAIFMKDNRLSFKKNYRKIQISFSFFEKIAIEVEFFLQNFTKSVKLSLRLLGHMWSCGVKDAYQ